MSSRQLPEGAGFSLMLRLALANKPAVGRLRDFVVERSGEQRGRLDIKHGGLLPVTSIARYASLAAGATVAASTPERLSAADAAGTLDTLLVSMKKGLVSTSGR